MIPPKDGKNGVYEKVMGKKIRVKLCYSRLSSA